MTNGPKKKSGVLEMLYPSEQRDRERWLRKIPERGNHMSKQTKPERRVTDQIPDTTIKKSEERFPKATPRPWRADRHDVIGGEGRNYVALICGGGTRTGNANRDLILEAVNSYDALREAAGAALRYVQVDPVLDDDGIVVIKQLRAALALVDHPEEAQSMKCQRCSTRDAIENETFCLPCRQELDQQRRDQRRSANEAQS